jgi:hypothetical protein
MCKRPETMTRNEAKTNERALPTKSIATTHNGIEWAAWGEDKLAYAGYVK